MKLGEMDAFSGFSDCNKLRHRALPSATSSVPYSDETGLCASIEYVSDGNGNETIPVFVTKAGNKVYIPPSIADLLRDKPPDHIGGSECDEEEFEDREKNRIEKDLDIESDDELDGIEVVSIMRKASKVSDDFLDSYWFTLYWGQVKHVGPKLVPFLKTLGLYFVIFIPDDRPSLLAMMIKCLPVISLALFIVLMNMNMQNIIVGGGKMNLYSKRILVGLVFSCLGDAFLIWPSYFLHGMAAFGVAQCFYIRAFGFQPMNMRLGLVVFTVTSSSLILILPGLLTDAFPIMVGVLIYSFLLTTMLWRSIDRVELSLESLSWSKLSSCIGGMFFAISDTILALNQFYTRIPYSQTLVMTTYYIAQLGIALSVVTKEEKLPKEENEHDDQVHADINEDSSVLVRRRKNKISI